MEIIINIRIVNWQKKNLIKRIDWSVLWLSGSQGMYFQCYDIQT